MLMRFISCVTILGMIMLLYGCTKTSSNNVGSFDSSMLYILFPVDSSLDRALLVSGSEIINSEYINYFNGDTELRIHIDKLTLYPPGNTTYKIYIDNLNKEISKWNDSIIKEIKYSYKKDCVWILIIQKNNKRISYKYMIKKRMYPINSQIKYLLSILYIDCFQTENIIILA